MPPILSDDELVGHAVDLLNLRDREHRATADFDALVGYYRSGAWKDHGIGGSDLLAALDVFGEAADSASASRQMFEQTFETALTERDANALRRSSILFRARQRHLTERERLPSGFDAWLKEKGIPLGEPEPAPIRKRARDRER